jgi:hypothetical protein
MHTVARYAAFLEPVANKFAKQHDGAVVVATDTYLRGLLCDVLALVKDRAGVPINAIN